MSERRRFIAMAGGLVAAATTAAIVDAPHVIAQPKFQWRLSTAWTPAILYQRAAEQLAKVVEEASNGRFRIEVFPGGQIMEPFDCFDATAQGKIEAFHAGALFWDAKELAGQWFTTVPFGMNCEGMAAWFYQGDGLKLRIPGLGGKVVARAGATVITLPPGQIYPALERGVIDTSEYVGPHDDMILGLHKTERYYYYPGWHQPGTTTEFGFNKKAYEALPVDLRRTLDHAAAAVMVYSLTDFHAKNAIALQRLRTEFKEKVEIIQFPAPMLRELKKFAAEVVREESEKSQMARKVHASFTKFQALVGPWDHVAEGAYHQLVAG